MLLCSSFPHHNSAFVTSPTRAACLVHHIVAAVFHRYQVSILALLPGVPKRRDSSVGIGTRLRTGWTIGVLGFDSWRGLGLFLFTTASRTAQEHKKPPIHWVPRALSTGVKRPGHEAVYSPSSSAEVKE
jgi:hypothetical protein